MASTDLEKHQEIAVAFYDAALPVDNLTCLTL